MPFDQRLTVFATLQNQRDFEALRTHFTKQAEIQSPVTPRGGSVDNYLHTLSRDRLLIAFADTESVYAFSDRAVTRSVMTASVPGRFRVQESVTIEWRREAGYWRIARMRLPNWSAVIGNWRRAGSRGEGSIELRMMPGGRYEVFVGRNDTNPAFRGRYRVEGNKVFLKDMASWEAANFDAREGRYVFRMTQNGVNFRKVEDLNPWRSERYEGDWTAAR